jgi:hypothetical protein
MPRRAATQRRLGQKKAGFVVVPPIVLLLCIGDTILFMKVHPLKIGKSTRIQPFYVFFHGMFRVDVKKQLENQRAKISPVKTRISPPKPGILNWFMLAKLGFELIFHWGSVDIS